MSEHTVHESTVPMTLSPFQRLPTELLLRHFLRLPLGYSNPRIYVIITCQALSLYTLWKAFPLRVLYGRNLIHSCMYVCMYTDGALGPFYVVPTIPGIIVLVTRYLTKRTNPRLNFFSVP